MEVTAESLSEFRRCYIDAHLCSFPSPSRLLFLFLVGHQLLMVSTEVGEQKRLGEEEVTAEWLNPVRISCWMAEEEEPVL